MSLYPQGSKGIYAGTCPAKLFSSEAEVSVPRRVPRKVPTGTNAVDPPPCEMPIPQIEKLKFRAASSHGYL
jgi:hypothetical protein